MLNRASHHPRSLLCLAVLALALAPGCIKKELPKPVSRYQELPPKEVPEFMKGTIFQYVDVGNTEPFPVSGYGLVANLNHTGDSTMPNRVREYMIKELNRHGFGSTTLPGYSEMTPERILRDDRFAVVEVTGFLPPGIRKGQWFDVQVSALRDNDTKSLSGGDLYQTDLRIFGADPNNPSGSVNVFARAQGPLFVNPAYAFVSDPDDPQALRSLRNAIVMDGGRAIYDRPLVLRLRRPQFSLSRRIEYRLDDRFQELPPDVIAAAQDEGRVNIYVPTSGPYAGDWEHFAQVALHTYLDSSAAFAARKARELAEEAVKPDAELLDISYCWEALGAEALPTVQEMMASDKPDIAYAAARAAVFLGDGAAPRALVEMAKNSEHPFRLNAIQTLGKLPSSPAINELLRPLLNVPETTVRIEAYKVLARNKDASIFTKAIQNKFALDIVRSSGPPLIYATRQGMPRIALIGDRSELDLPALFTAVENRLMISSDAEHNGTVTIYYRSPLLPLPVKVESSPNIAEIVARLAGEGSSGGGLNFNYAQIVAILNALTEQQKVSAALASGDRKPASFMLQETGPLQAEIFAAPPIDAGRPQGDEPKQVGLAE